jgi:hypothetical protein
MTEETTTQYINHNINNNITSHEEAEFVPKGDWFKISSMDIHLFIQSTPEHVKTLPNVIA